MKIQFKNSIFFLILLIYSSLSANNEFNGFSKNLGNSSGTEFLLTVPPVMMGSSGNEYLKIYIISEFNSTVHLEINSKSYFDTKNVEIGKVSEFNVPIEIAQPLIKDPKNPFFESKVFANSAIRLYSEYPFTAFGLVKTSNSSEGFLIYPITTNGTNYTVSSYPDASKYYPQYSMLPSTVGIVANYNGTEVQFKVGGNSLTQTSDGKKPGEIISKFMNKGDVWLVSSKGQGADLSGSIISSNLPISVINSNQCANIPIDNKYCNYLVEQQSPNNFWGKTYLVGDIYSRKYHPILRIFASEPNTKIYLNGNEINQLNFNSNLIDESYFEYRLENNYKLNVISSDKPIFVSLYNTGVEEEGLPEPPGDPFQINQIPLEQFTQFSMFTLPSQIGSSNFAKNYLNLICELDATEQIPDDMYITEYQFNQTTKTKVRDLKNILLNENSNITLNNKKYALLTLKLPSSGQFEISSSTKFASYNYGFSETDAYGYQSNLGMAELYVNDKEAPKVDYNIDCEGNIIGQTNDLPDDAQNCSNLGGVIYYSAESSNITKLNFDQIIPGKTKSINWNLKIKDISKDAKALLQFWDFAFNVTNVEINYKAPKVEISSVYENYGAFKVGDTLSKTFTIKNSGDSIFKLSRLNLLNSKDFKIVTNLKNEIYLKKDEIYTFEVKFTANLIGNIIDSIGFGNECFYQYFTKLEAFVGSPVIEVSDINFSDVTIGKSSSLNSRIKNIGKTSLILTSFSLPNNNVFSVDFKRKLDASNPLILLPNEYHDFQVTFTPQNEDKLSDQIIISSDASQIDSICFINAHGVKPGLIATSFNWEKRRIHRKEFPAGPYPIPLEGIKITNTSNVTITVSGIEILSEKNSTAFEFNKQVLLNQKLAPGKEFTFPVYFRPEQLGYHELIFKYKDNMNGVAQTELRGFGVLPSIKQNVIDYDTALVDNISNPNKAKIIIENLPSTAYEFADTLNIYDINNNEDEISSSWNMYGSLGFKIDKAVLDFPIKLAPGGKLEINSAFVAQKDGLVESNLNIISDAESVNPIKLKGFGINQNIEVLGGTGLSCINNFDIIDVRIKNKSTNVQTVNKVFLKLNQNEFSLQNKNQENGFTLQPEETVTVPILFRPNSVVDITNELVFQNSSKYGFEKSATINGKTKSYKVNIIPAPLIQEVSAGDEIQFKVNLNSNSNLEELIVGDLICFIKYNPDFCLADFSNLNLLGPFTGKYELNIDSSSKNKGIILIEFKNISNDKTLKVGDMFNLPFRIFKPNDTSKSVKIESNITALNNDCLEFLPNYSYIEVKSNCADEIRRINFSDVNYQFFNINPNPISGDNVTIKFDLGLSSAILLSVTNSIGEEVIRKDINYLKAGGHELDLNLMNISTGVYNIKLVAGPFTKSQMLIINK